DQINLDFAREKGKELAKVVLEHKDLYPDDPVHLLGHSAGAAVVLAAAESLPAESLDTVVLLAPSVGRDYDVRPSLRAVRRELAVFCSCRDGWYLKVGSTLGAFFHGDSAVAAGCNGFEAASASPADMQLYAKLKHYPWQPWFAWMGNDGGHYGAYQQ